MSAHPFTCLLDCTQLNFSTLRAAQGMGPPTVGLVFPHQLNLIRQFPKDQPIVENSSLSHSCQVILGCFKLIIKASNRIAGYRCIQPYQTCTQLFMQVLTWALMLVCQPLYQLSHHIRPHFFYLRYSPTQFRISSNLLCSKR